MLEAIRGSVMSFAPPMTPASFRVAFVFSLDKSDMLLLIVFLESLSYFSVHTFEDGRRL